MTTLVAIVGFRIATESLALPGGVQGLAAKAVTFLSVAGNGTFVPTASYPTGQETGSIAVGDVNGDGKSDLVALAYQPDMVKVLPNNGDGTFAAPVDSPLGMSASDLVVADLDNDGKGDVAVSFPDYATVGVMRSLGNGALGALSGFAAGRSVRDLVAVDLDHDGRLDLAVANFDGYDVSILRFRESRSRDRRPGQIPTHSLHSFAITTIYRVACIRVVSIDDDRYLPFAHALTNFGKLPNPSTRSRNSVQCVETTRYRTVSSGRCRS